MSGHTTRDHDQPLAEINVTPMVDIMLVLLVIFILLTPMISNSLQVELPRANSTPLNEPRVADLNITPQGELLLDGKRAERREIITQLQQCHATSPELVLRLNADRDTHYEHVAQTLALLKEAGLTRIAFATQPP